MAPIIRDGRLVPETWQWLDSAQALTALAPGARIVLPFPVWREVRDALTSPTCVFGISVAATAEPADFAEDVARLAFIGVHFPKSTDGRGYSLARILRDRYRYGGELRAFGGVSRDQLYDLLRCGFDSFQLREGEDPRAALASLHPFSESYQATALSPLPLFRRRLAA